MASPKGLIQILCNHWGRKGRRRDEHNGAAQARVIFRGHHVDFSCAAKLG
jgi:hypothetical protein